MFKIISKTLLAPNIWEMVVENPRLAQKAKAGQFLIVMPEENGERIPLTIADFDREKGTITMVIMAVGVTSRKVIALEVGQSLYAMIGPLGQASEIDTNFGTVIMVAGGVGTAPIYPIAKAFRESGVKVISVQGARTKDLLFWTDKLASVSDEHIVVTDDGSFGRKALVTEPVKEILETRGSEIGCVYTIGPAIMMKFTTLTAKPFTQQYPNLKCIASLNTIMIDGTGMCGGCRVKLGDKVKFTCVDGPEFDAFLIDWDSVMQRQRIYCEQEKCSLNRYIETLDSKQ